MSYYIENLDIISKRFPFLYLLFISNIEISKKSKIYQSDSKLDIDNVDTLFIYKCCISEEKSEEIKKWLNSDKKIYFFDDDLNNLRLFFNTKIANDFLKNENVSFHFFSKIPQLIEQITPTIKTKKVKVITFVKKTKKFETLRKEIMQFSAISYFANHDRIYSYKIFKNFYSNFEQLKSSFLINKFKDKFKNMPAIVLGAGPSLKHSFSSLKRLQNQALLIAGGSAITCLSNVGILPHLGVIIDPNFEEFDRMKNSLSFEIPMIYSTRVNSGVFKTFNGPMGYIKGQICGFFETWLDKELKIWGKSIYSRSLEKALSVTTVSLMLAKMLGCNPIILDGLDLAYSQYLRYSVDIIQNNKLEETQNENYLTKDKHDNAVYTNLNWEIERDWLDSFAKENKNITLLNATKDGLKIDNILDISLDEVEKKYLKNQFDFKSYIHYLSQDSYIVKDSKKDFDVMKLTLKESFKRCQNYLKQIVDNQPEYLAILAKEELVCEIAYKYFLLELDFTLKKFYKDEKNFEKLKEVNQLFLNLCESD